MKPALVLAAVGIITIIGVHAAHGVFRVEYFAAESYSVGKLVGPFVFGAVIATWQHERWLMIAPMIAIVTVLLLACAIGGDAMVQSWSLVAVAIGGLALAIGLRRWSWLSTITPKSDYSYGLYLYAFPIQQALIAANPTITTPLLITITTVLALAFAMLSWHAVERPFLALKTTPSVRNAFRTMSTRVFATVFATLLGFALVYGVWRLIDQRVLKTQPPKDPIAAIGHLDTPLQSFRSGQSVRVIGWVWHPAGVRSAQLIIGGQPISRVALIRTRLDVSAVHAEKIGILHSGFEVQLRNTYLSAVAKNDVINLKIELHNGSVSTLRFGEIP
jgi:hypothetical protein